MEMPGFPQEMPCQTPSKPTGELRSAFPVGAYDGPSKEKDLSETHGSEIADLRKQVNSMRRRLAQLSVVLVVTITALIAMAARFVVR